MNTQEISNKLVEYCRTGEFEKAQRELYADDAISIEPYAMQGFEKETKGLQNILEKGKKFEAMVQESHSNTVSNPLVTANSIAFILTMDITMKGQPRMAQSELCVYEVKDGKIVSEQFFT